MTDKTDQPFIKAFGIRRKDVVSLVGAGGKTSLMFRLAQEGRAQGFKVLVTTSTKILTPQPEQYDYIDLSGKLFTDQPVTEAGIYVGGLKDTTHGKITAVREDLLIWQQKQFDLLLIEADGAAQKPLKGWKSNEPVIPAITSKTIGVLDIQTIGRTINESLVHRLELFSELTGAQPGERIGPGHLLRIIFDDTGLFAEAIGTELLYLNKVESTDDRHNVDRLRAQLENLKIVAGSVQQGTIYG